MAAAEARLPRGLALALETFAARMRERFGEAVVGLRLFGSYAQARAHEDSDVDVAVVLEQADWQTRKEVIDLATDTGLEHDLLLSPAIFERSTYERWLEQERPLVMDIEREGVAL